MRTCFSTTCPNCGSVITVEQVRCAKCRRLVSQGDYVLAPERSVYAGWPLCTSCIDGIQRVYDPLREAEFK